MRFTQRLTKYLVIRFVFSNGSITLHRGINQALVCLVMRISRNGPRRLGLYSALTRLSPLIETEFILPSSAEF
jgi:hypothetical protein